MTIHSRIEAIDVIYYIFCSRIRRKLRRVFSNLIFIEYYVKKCDQNIEILLKHFSVSYM